jgi:hypothetical protein
MSDLGEISKHGCANLILSAEIGALIHDLGKMSRDFIIQQSKECYDDRTCISECQFDHEKILKKTGFIDQHLISKLTDDIWRSSLKYNKIPEFKQAPEHLGHFISGHSKSNTKIGLLGVITRCDKADSGVDKGALQDSAKQRAFGTYISSAFGYEEKLPIYPLYDRLVNERCNWSNEINKSLDIFIDRKSYLVNERSSILDITERAFRQALGETRRAANDVTLWDHAYSVACLQKAAIAQMLMQNAYPRDLSKLQWRILRITFNGLQFLESSNHISDLLGKLEIIHEALNRVKILLEITLPLGNEIYSDENGSAFIVPDVENLLDLKDDQDRVLREFIESEFGKELYGEISIELSPYWISNSSRYSIELGRMLSLPLPHLTSDATQVINQWDVKYNAEICTVCGIRPVGYPVQGSISKIEQALSGWATPDKAQKRNICRICLDRRGRRAHQWISHEMNKTIWTDEATDTNGRMAFIIGCFDLENWMDGRLLSTILGQEFPKGWQYGKLVGQLSKEIENNVCPDKSNQPLIQKMAPEAFRGDHNADSFYQAFVEERDIHNLAIEIAGDDYDARAELLLRHLLHKNPSFARLRRIWETTQNFWNDVCPANKTEDLKKSLVGQEIGLDGPRLEIRGRTKRKGRDEKPGPYHAYDLVLSKGIKLSVAWDPQEGKNDSQKGRLISIDNLAYFTSLSNENAPSNDENEYKRRLHKWAAEVTKKLILQEMVQGPLLIEEPTGYGGKAKEWGEIYVEDVEIIQDSQYTPAIPILAEPRTFMALVPADKALNVVNEIKAKYEREMGKVRNRLPMHLGIVYAHRRTPLRAILDAGRRMLNQSSMSGGWKVVCAARKLKDRCDPLPERFSTDCKGQLKEWLEILLERDGRRINWFVPAVMGDGETLDQWYPYVFLDNSAEPTDRDRRFKALNPWTGSDGWLVHAADLKTDDVVFFTPATLDFQWLDSAGRRFEIAYDDKGQRFSMPRRPYLLDELESLNEIWQTLKSHLKKSQIYILRDLIEAKRADWQEKTLSFSRDNVFWRFCRDAIANAEWMKGKEDNMKDKLPWEIDGKGFDVWLDRWTDYAVRGWITDAVELHLQIMKEEITSEF